MCKGLLVRGHDGERKSVESERKSMWNEEESNGP